MHVVAVWKAFGRFSSVVEARSRRPSQPHSFVILMFVTVFLLGFVPSLQGREHKRKVASEDYGLGFSTEIAAPEGEVIKAVEAVVNNGIIQGSKEFNKDKYVESATSATSSPLFPEWKGPGKVYYKVRAGVLAPMNFKDSNDEGTLAVRYVVQGKDASKSILRIDAVFVEDFRRTVHPSDGSVENAESQEIQNQIDAVEAEKNSGWRSWPDRSWNASACGKKQPHSPPPKLHPKLSTNSSIPCATLRSAWSRPRGGSLKPPPSAAPRM
jgi:hypothetical protein